MTHSLVSTRHATVDSFADLAGRPLTNGINAASRCGCRSLCARCQLPQVTGPSGPAAALVAGALAGGVAAFVRVVNCHRSRVRQGPQPRWLLVR